MANLILVMGESGSGKTYSLRNLDPATTMIIDCDKKGLPWRGWRKSYNRQAQNYVVTDRVDTALRCLRHVDEDVPTVTVAVVDTINGLMVADEGRRMREKGYDKWLDLAWSVYGLIDEALTMRPDLTIIFTGHTQTERDDSGMTTSTRLKTSGKKLDKIVLESKFNTVLWAKKADGENVFVTDDDNATCKAPPGLFGRTIPNDIFEVVSAEREFEFGEPLPRNHLGGGGGDGADE